MVGVVPTRSCANTSRAMYFMHHVLIAPSVVCCTPHQAVERTGVVWRDASQMNSGRLLFPHLHEGRGHVGWRTIKDENAGAAGKNSRCPDHLRHHRPKPHRHHHSHRDCIKRLSVFPSSPLSFLLSLFLSLSFFRPLILSSHFLFSLPECCARGRGLTLTFAGPGLQPTDAWDHTL